MAEVEEECKFTVRCDCVRLVTNTNGDTIHITDITLDQKQATSLAWLINNQPSVLDFEVKLHQE